MSRKIFSRITAGFMIVIMALLFPMQSIKLSYAKDNDKDSGKTYISEVKIGMGETEEEAKKELEEEGYTILKDSGKNADLNKDAGSKSSLKRGANDKIVYLGYKTTKDPEEAITDLAVMNMNGGYSIEDYNILMDQQMDSQIKPFVDRFISALEEYRANYAKEKTDKSYIRADHIRRYLNKMTDDDTGDKPLGDLLLNKTKYELGDKAYNALSDSDKKNHADILTILMQANGKATLSIEKLITRAADSGDDSWIDRLKDTTLDDLIDRTEKENKSLTSKTDILKELDKKYYDTASGILKKWDELHDKIEDYGDIAEDLYDNMEDVAESISETEDIDFKNATEEEVEEVVEKNIEVKNQIADTQTVAVCSYLETIDYEDGTLLDYFNQDYDEISGDKGIRKLYPIVDALSAGQIAGLDFMTLEEMISNVLADEESYKKMDEEMEKIETVSIYEGVDREIYEKGGVALTNDSLRAKATATDVDSGDYQLGTLNTVLWITTGCFIAATIVSGIVRQAMTASVWNSIPKLAHKFLQTGSNIGIWNNVTRLNETVNLAQRNLNFELQGIFNDRAVELYLYPEKTVNLPGPFSKFLTYGMAAIAVILTVVSTVMTILEAQKFYDTEYIPIPKFMVDEADITAYDDKGEKIVVKNQSAYYKAVTCNRKEGDSDIEKENYEAMGDIADLNGDIGKQWLALYAVKYKYGKPILADSLLYQINGDKVPQGYTTGIHEFGSKPACDLNKKLYLFPDNPPQIKVFYKNDTDTVENMTAESKSEINAPESGSIFSVGSFSMGTALGLIFGGAIMFALVRKKRKEE